MLRTEFTPPLSSPTLSLLISDRLTSSLRPPIERKFSFAKEILLYYFPSLLSLFFLVFSFLSVIFGLSEKLTILA